MLFPQPPVGDTRQQLTDPATTVRTSQIICCALIAAVSVFMVLALVMKGEQKPATVSYIALLFAATVIGARFFVPANVARMKMKEILKVETDHLDARLFQALQSKMIIGVALLEGGAFFNLIAFLTERQIWSLAVVGVLLVLMALQFPTMTSFQSAVEDAKRDLQSQF